jgi:hypothetical protein
MHDCKIPTFLDRICNLHKRREFDVTQLIGTLDVEDKVRAKDVKGNKNAEGGSSAHVVQKNRSKPQKKKNQQE